MSPRFGGRLCLIICLWVSGIKRVERRTWPFYYVFSSNLVYEDSVRTQNDRKKCTRNRALESNSVSFRYAVLRAGPGTGRLGRLSHSAHSYVCWLWKWLIVCRALVISSRLRLLNVCPRILYAVVCLTMLSVNQLHAIKPVISRGSKCLDPDSNLTHSEHNSEALPLHVYPLCFRRLRKIAKSDYLLRQWRTQEFCSGGGGVQQIQLRTEDRDLGAVAPYSGVLEATVIWYKKFHFI